MGEEGRGGGGKRVDRRGGGREREERGEGEGREGEERDMNRALIRSSV